MIACPACSTKRPPGVALCPLCHPVSPPGGDEASCPEMPTGTVLARRYQINVQVSTGEGSTSTVYLARDQLTGLDVALKFPPVLISDDAQYLRDFCREATVCLRLTHENIVRVWNLEIVGSGTVPFLVMEYLAGPSLGRLMIERFQTTGSARIGLYELVEILPGLARALDHAHTLGIVHRDIKPSNILLTGPLGEPGTIAKLADFGIAAQVRSTVSQHVSRLSSDGRRGVPGTLPYMSPEQVRGRSLTAASDVYSLAATIYHLVTGGPPFSGSSVDLVHHIVSSPPQPVAWLPGRASSLLLKALAKDPQDRPPTASDFVDLLVSAAPPRPLEPSPADEIQSPMPAASLPPGTLVPSTRGEIPRGPAPAVSVPPTDRLTPVDAGSAAHLRKTPVASGSSPFEPSTPVAFHTPVEGGGLAIPAVPGRLEGDPVQRYNLGLRLAADGRPGEAVRVIRSAVHDDDRLYVVWYMSGSPLGSEINWAQVAEAAKRAADSDSSEASHRLDLGFALAKQRLWGEALEAYQAVTRLTPDDAKSWSLLADAFNRCGRWHEARAAADRSIELDPRSAHAQVQRGLALAGLKQWAEAEAAFRRSITAAPTSPLAWTGLADSLNWLGRWDEAADACRKATDLHDGYARAWDSLGVALGGLGRWSEAEAAVRRALDLDDTDAVTWGNLADALIWQGRWSEAETACRRAIETKKTYGKVWNSLGVALGGQGRWRESEDALRKALQYIPRDPEAWVNLASTLNWLGFWDEAAAACRKAIDLLPGLVTAWENLGYAEEKRGVVADARHAYERALSIDPASAVATEGLARLAKG